MMDERRRALESEWNSLNERDAEIDEKRQRLLDARIEMLNNEQQHEKEEQKQQQPGGHGDRQHSENVFKLKHELEKLKLEKRDLHEKLTSAQRLVAKYNRIQKDSTAAVPTTTSDHNAAAANVNVHNTSHSGGGSRHHLDDITETSEEAAVTGSEDLLRSSKRSVRIADNGDDGGDIVSYDDDDEEEDDDDEKEIRDLVKHAKLKLKLKYAGEKKRAELSSLNDDLDDLDDANDNDNDNEDALDDSMSRSLSNVSRPRHRHHHHQHQHHQHQLHHARHHRPSPSTTTRAAANTSASSGSAIEQHCRRAVLESVANETGAIELANELLENYRATLLKRKAKLSAAKQALGEAEEIESRRGGGGGGGGGSERSRRERERIEERKMALERESLGIEQLQLNIKNGKRLVRQKKSQLRLLEASVTSGVAAAEPDSHFLALSSSSTSTDASSSSSSSSRSSSALSSSSSSDSEADVDDENMAAAAAHSVTSNSKSAAHHQQQHKKQPQQANLDGLVAKLRRARLKGELGEFWTSKIGPILKRVPKLNTRLADTLANLSSMMVTTTIIEQQQDVQLSSSKKKKKSNKAEAAAAATAAANTRRADVEAIWQRNLVENKLFRDEVNKRSFYARSSFDSQLANNRTTAAAAAAAAGVGGRRDWENSAAYQRLTFEQRHRTLDDKWSKYIGSSSGSKAAASISAAPMPARAGSFFSFGNVNLPASTQQALVQHRQWLQRFKEQSKYDPRGGNK